MQVLFDVGPWMATKDCDPRAFAIFTRHYSFYKYADRRRSDPKNRNRFAFVGPGGKLVLVSRCYDALFVWRKFKDDCIDQQTGQPQAGVNCSVFRNEGKQQSSELILEAETLAWKKWPGERLYTYVNGTVTAKRRGKRNPPGYCFRMAGWEECGETKGGLVILEKKP